MEKIKDWRVVTFLNLKGYAKLDKSDIVIRIPFATKGGAKDVLHRLTG